jgi:N-acetylneuraminic acid mutarotase
MKTGIKWFRLQVAICILFSCFMIVQSVHADYWTQKASYPGNGSSRAFCFSIGDKGYFGCGYMGSAANDFWQYDTTSNTWSQMASFGGGGRWSGLSFSVGGFGFAGLGWNATMMDDIWKYDPVANAWTQMNNFPTGQRQLPTAFIIGNKAYISNGRDFSNAFQNDLWEYDPANDSWTQKSNVPGPSRSQAFAFSINGLGYVGAGFDQMLNGLNDFYEYDPVTNAWTTKASLPATGRGDPAGFAIGCRGYTGTGQTLPQSNVLNDFWEFNPAINQWTAKASFGGSARDEASFFVIGEKGYIGLGGVNGGFLTQDIWEYTPDTTCLQVIPVASFSAMNHICPGTCTDFTNLSTGATSYVWTFSGANPGMSTDVNPTTICYSTPGSYSVSLIAINATSSDTVTLNNFITVFNLPPPQGIIQNGDTLIANQGSVTYQWYFNGSIITGATEYFYVAPQSGNYSVVASDENNCEVEAVMNNVIANSQLAVGPKTSGQFVIFPNPVSEILEIKNLNPGSEYSFIIFNTLGMDVSLSTVIPIAIGSQLPTYPIDVSGLASGIYLLEISDGKKISRQNLMKK